MIDIKKLKDIVRMMVENDLVELDLRDQEETVVIKRPNVAAGMAGAGPVVYGPPVVSHYPAMPNAAGAAASGAGAGPAGGSGDDEEAGLVAITSPMVGTFYAAADPNSPPFVSVGTSVGPDTVVCIVEAMKVFSEIKAERSGTIRKVLVKNGDAVEYGQKLYLVKTS